MRLAQQTLLLTVFTSSFPFKTSFTGGGLLQKAVSQFLPSAGDFGSLAPQPVPISRSKHDWSRDLSISTEKGRWIV